MPSFYCAWLCDHSHNSLQKSRLMALPPLVPFLRQAFMVHKTIVRPSHNVLIFAKTCSNGEKAKRGEKLLRNRWVLKEMHPVHSHYLLGRKRSHILSEEPPGTISPSLEKRQTSAKKFETSSIDDEPCQSLRKAGTRLKDNVLF